MKASSLPRTPEKTPLLRVDHRAAIAKLVRSQLQGSWELPGELVRWAIACGARSVALEISPNRLALSAREAQIRQKTFADFASILDDALDLEARHRALVELEEHEGFALAAIACSTFRSLVLETGLPQRASAQGMKLELRTGGELRISPPHTGDPEPSDVELAIEGLELESEKAERWLARAGRFARVPITINGRPIERGFTGGLIRGRIAAAAARGSTASTVQEARSGVLPSLPAALSISPRGSAPHLWLLRHGIVTTRATVPGYPPFEAAVEMAPVAPGNLGAAALRERLGPYLHSLLDGALALAIRWARQPGAWTEDARARVARILLEALRKRRRVAEISGVKIFPLESSGGRHLVSIDEIARRVRVESGGICTLEAIPPGRDPRSFALPERGALVLSETERALLGDHLCVVFNAPPACLRHSWRYRLAASLAALARALRLPGGRQLADHELTAEERTFLGYLRTALASSIDGAAPEVGLRSGSGPPIHADGRLVLARSHPDVRLAMRAVLGDSGWLYPAMACLLEKCPLAAFDLSRSEPRRQWLKAAA